MSIITRNSIDLLQIDEDDADFMYNSLCSLSDPKNKLRKQRKQVSTEPILYKNVDKELTFVLNECFSTDGQAPIIVLCDENLNTKRKLYNKTIKSIGTSLKNCEISDMISIDIEAESTRLPLMCKLMIIVEGAAYERGKRLLVKDGSAQAGDGRLISGDREIEISVESSCKNHLIRSAFTDLNGSLMRIRSNENINYDEYNEQMNQHANRKRANINSFDRNTCGGSLTNLTNSFYSLGENNSNYFIKKSDSLSSESNLDLYEYISTPFYQYQRKNLDNIDFSHGIQEEFIRTKQIITKQEQQEQQQKNFQETVEVHIPIQLQFPEVQIEPEEVETEIQLVPIKLRHNININHIQPNNISNSRNELHRNEKRIMITHNHNPNEYFIETYPCLNVVAQNSNDVHMENHLDSLRQFTSQMRQYFNERMTQFDSNFSLLNQNENFMKQEAEMLPAISRPQSIQVNHVNQASNTIINNNNVIQTDRKSVV